MSLAAIPESSIVTDAALARLHDYLRREPSRTDVEEIIARDAFISGFHYGARWLAKESGSLAATCNPDFRVAITVLAEVLKAEPS